MDLSASGASHLAADSAAAGEHCPCPCAHSFGLTPRGNCFGYSANMHSRLHLLSHLLRSGAHVHDSRDKACSGRGCAAVGVAVCSKAGREVLQITSPRVKAHMRQVSCTFSTASITMRPSS